MNFSKVLLAICMICLTFSNASSQSALEKFFSGLVIVKPIVAIDDTVVLSPPDVGTWYGKEKTSNVTCVLLRSAIAISLNTGNVTQISVNAPARGHCSNPKWKAIDIAFQIPGLVVIPHDDFRNFLTFNFTIYKSYYRLDSVTHTVNSYSQGDVNNAALQPVREFPYAAFFNQSSACAIWKATAPFLPTRITSLKLTSFHFQVDKTDTGITGGFNPEINVCSWPSDPVEPVVQPLPELPSIEITQRPAVQQSTPTNQSNSLKASYAFITTIIYSFVFMS